MYSCSIISACQKCRVYALVGTGWRGPPGLTCILYPLTWCAVTLHCSKFEVYIPYILSRERRVMYVSARLAFHDHALQPMSHATSSGDAPLFDLYHLILCFVCLTLHFCCSIVF